jgi:hypothetical protein
VTPYESLCAYWRHTFKTDFPLSEQDFDMARWMVTEVGNLSLPAMGRTKGDSMLAGFTAVSFLASIEWWRLQATPGWFLDRPTNHPGLCERFLYMAPIRGSEYVLEHPADGSRESL